MHIALVIDDERLYREHSAINRLCIALMAEGAELTRIVPEEHLDDEPQLEQRMGLCRRFGVPFHVLPWMRASRSNAILKSLEKTQPDVIHVIGERGWQLGIDLSKTFDCPVSIELDKGSQVLRVPRGRGVRQIAAYVAPTVPIADALRMRVDSDLVSYVPTGVAIPPRQRDVFENPHDGIGMVILGRATDLGVYRAMLDALGRLTKRYPQLQLFIELPSKKSHEIWRHAQRVGLLPRLSAIGRAADHRALITRCDMAIMPQSGGVVRTIALELLARGVPVIATDDPWLDFFVEGQTATLVGGLDIDEWDGSIGRMIEHPDIARAQGSRAREWMKTHRPSSTQASTLMSTLSRAVSGTALPFEAPA